MALLEDYAASGGVYTLRFGTSEGLEHSVNSTLNGTRVVSRSTATGCLETYLDDGVTSDGSTDDCLYDPRYTA